MGATRFDGGLRGKDLVKLTRGQIENTPNGRRLRVRANKRKQIAAIPISAELSRLIDKPPRDRILILVDSNGWPFDGPKHAYRGVTKYRKRVEVDQN